MRTFGLVGAALGLRAALRAPAEENAAHAPTMAHVIPTPGAVFWAGEMTSAQTATADLTTGFLARTSNRPPGNALRIPRSASRMIARRWHRIVRPRWRHGD